MATTRYARRQALQDRLRYGAGALVGQPGLPPTPPAPLREAELLQPRQSHRGLSPLQWGLTSAGSRLSGSPVGQALLPGVGQALQSTAVGQLTPPQALQASASLGLAGLDLATAGATAPVRTAGRNLLRQLPKGEQVPITHFSAAQRPQLEANMAGTNTRIRGAERARGGLPSVHGYQTDKPFQIETGLGREVMHGKARRVLDLDSKTAKKISRKVRDRLQKQAEASAAGRWAPTVSPQDVATELEREAFEQGYYGIKRSTPTGDVVKSFEDIDIQRRGQVAPGMVGPGLNPESVARYAASQPEGFTINPMTGEVPLEGIARARAGSEEVLPSASPERIAQYLQENPPAPGEYLGGWQNQGRMYLDQSKVFPADQGLQARLSGEANYQKALFDIGAGEEIPLAIRPGVEAATEGVAGAVERGLGRGIRMPGSFGMQLAPPPRADVFLDAKKHKPEAVQAAEELQAAGADRDQIWDRTGLFQDTQKNWLVELPDIGVKSKINTPPPEAPKRDPLVDLFGPAAAAPAQSKGRKGKRQLRNVIEHPELFKLEPELGRIPVRFDRTQVQAGGAYKPGTVTPGKVSGEMRLIAPPSGAGTIGLGAEKQAVDFDDLVPRIALHESEHALQHAGGRARGGSPTSRHMDQWQAAARDKTFDMRQAEIDKLPGDDPQKAVLQNKLMEDYRVGNLWPGSKETYYRLAGEDEAYNVEERLKVIQALESIGTPPEMIREHMRTLRPWETRRQDYPEESLITVPHVSEGNEAFRIQDQPLKAGTRTTVKSPQRKVFPKVYQDPRASVEEAALKIPPQSPNLGMLFGTSRQELDELTRTLPERVPQMEVPIYPGTGRGAQHTQQVMMPANAQRL